MNREQNPMDHRLTEYAWAASLFSRVRIFPRDPKACSMLMALGPNDNPFYGKAKLYRARFLQVGDFGLTEDRKSGAASILFSEEEYWQGTLHGSEWRSDVFLTRNIRDMLPVPGVPPFDKTVNIICARKQELQEAHVLAPECFTNA